jgi:glycosyltransferase involved in cell wall biosynthesis
MKISLCLPVFKRPAMLAQCLASVIAQNYDDYEIVMKDGCLDFPACDVRSLRPQFWKLRSHLRYILSEDRGIFPALNEALKNATGDILYFLCSDDKLGAPDVLRTVVDNFVETGTSEPCWLYGVTGGMDANGERNDHLGGAPMTFGEYMKQRGGIGQPAVFWSRGMYEAIGGFDTNYKHAADYDYWVRCWLQAKPRFINKILGIGRRWSEASSTIHAEEVEKEVVMIHTRYAASE